MCLFPTKMGDMTKLWTELGERSRKITNKKPQKKQNTWVKTINVMVIIQSGGHYVPAHLKTRH